MKILNVKYRFKCLSGGYWAQLYLLTVDNVTVMYVLCT